LGSDCQDCDPFSRILPALKLEKLKLRSVWNICSETLIAALAKSSVRHLELTNLTPQTGEDQWNSLASALPRLQNLVTLEVHVSEVSAPSLAVLLRSLPQSPVRSLRFAGYGSTGLKYDDLKLSVCYDLVKKTNLSCLSVDLIEKPRDNSPICSEFTLSTPKGLCYVTIGRRSGIQT
jgi:hypothetical protein